MRAVDVLNTLDRVALFRAQAADSHRRVEDIGGDLDSAISLLDLGQQQSRHALKTPGKSCGTSLLLTINTTVCSTHQISGAALLDRSLEDVARGCGVAEFLPLRSSWPTGALLVKRGHERLYVACCSTAAPLPTAVHSSRALSVCDDATPTVVVDNSSCLYCYLS